MQVEEQPTAVVRGHVTRAGIAQFLDEVFREVMGVIAIQGRSPAGPPFGCYDPTPDGFWVEAGFPTDAPVSPQGRVEASTPPGGSALSVLHHGEYADLPAAYRAAEAWVAEHNWESTGMPWESYLDGPEVAEHRTAVFWPARPRIQRTTWE